MDILASFVQPTVGPSLLPGSCSNAVALRWIPAVVERPNAYLLARDVDWLEFAEESSLARLQGLRFAQSSGGMSPIAGSPLPAIPGQYFYEEEGVAFPLRP